MNTHKDRKQLLSNYLEKYKTLEKMTTNIEGKRLYDNFYSYKDDIYKTAEEIGYNLDDIVNNYPKGYFNDFSVIEKKLNKFIAENNRFPLSKEIQGELRINYKYLKQYGYVDGLKKLLNYEDKNDLIDLRGDSNKSIWELFIANFLIENGLKESYKREQHPFPKYEGDYRSDFTFYLDDGKELHIEAWGTPQRDTLDKRTSEYLKVRKDKELLYKKYGNKVILLGLDYEIYMKNNYKDLQKILNEKLIDYLNFNFKEVDYEKLIVPYKMTNQGIYNEIMKFSKDGFLPATSYIIGTLYNEMLKRYNTYDNFAKEFNIPIKPKKLPSNRKDNLEFDNNYFNVKTKLGKIPTRKEFINNTNIDLKSYQNRFRFNNNFSIYDNIIAKYEEKEGYTEYLKNKYKTNLI